MKPSNLGAIAFLAVLSFCPPDAEGKPPPEIADSLLAEAAKVPRDGFLFGTERDWPDRIKIGKYEILGDERSDLEVGATTWLLRMLQKDESPKKWSEVFVILKDVEYSFEHSTLQNPIQKVIRKTHENEVYARWTSTTGTWECKIDADAICFTYWWAHSVTNGDVSLDDISTILHSLFRYPNDAGRLQAEKSFVRDGFTSGKMLCGFSGDPSRASANDIGRWYQHAYRWWWQDVTFRTNGKVAVFRFQKCAGTVPVNAGSGVRQ